MAHRSQQGCCLWWPSPCSNAQRIWLVSQRTAQLRGVQGRNGKAPRSGEGEACVKQTGPDVLPGRVSGSSSLRRPDVVGKDHRRAPAGLQDGQDVNQEVELFVGRLDGEVVSAGRLVRFLCPKRWVCEYYLQPFGHTPSMNCSYFSPASLATNPL